MCSLFGGDVSGPTIAMQSWMGAEKTSLYDQSRWADPPIETAEGGPLMYKSRQVKTEAAQQAMVQWSKVEFLCYESDSHVTLVAERRGNTEVKCEVAWRTENINVANDSYM